MSKSFYDMLGVSRDATGKQVRESYRRLARDNHPDVNPGDPEAEARFKRVNEAYHVLSDEKRRKDYDEFGEHWQRADDIRKAGAGAGGRGGYRTVNFGGAPDGHGGFGDLGDLGDLLSGFGAGFGGHAGPGKARRSSQNIVVKITLQEAFTGTKRVVSYRRPESCSACGGQGVRGHAICSSCGGSGATDTPVRLEVTIPPGIDDGGKIRLRPDRASEIIIRIKVAADKTFRRTGADLHITVMAPYTDVVLGGEVEVPTMSGTVALRIPAGTENGRVFRLAAKGMPKKGGGGVGTLYATVLAQLPGVLSDEERDLFERLKELRNGAISSAETNSGQGDETEI